MRLTQFKTLDAGRHVQGFLDNQAAALGTTVSPILRASLDQAVAQLSAYQLEQDMASGSAAGETSTQAALRQDIYDRFMKPIARIAKAKLRGVTEFNNLVVPAVLLTAGRVGDFYSAAYSLATAAASYEKLLIDNSLPSDFIAQLKAAIGQLDASAGSRAVQRGRKAAATKGLGEMDKEIRDAIGIIDAVLTKFFKGNPALKAQWDVSKRITQTAVTPNPTGSPGGTTASAPSTPTTSPTADGTKPAA